MFLKDGTTLLFKISFFFFFTYRLLIKVAFILSKILNNSTIVKYYYSLNQQFILFVLYVKI